MHNGEQRECQMNACILRAVCRQDAHLHAVLILGIVRKRDFDRTFHRPAGWKRLADCNQPEGCLFFFPAVYVFCLPGAGRGEKIGVDLGLIIFRNESGSEPG